MAETLAKGLPDDDTILDNLTTSLNDNLNVTQNWRNVEVKENFAIFEGKQWSEEAFRRQVADGMPAITINRVAPVLEAIAGFQIQNRLDINYVPRILNPEQVGFKDVVKPTAKYIEQSTKAQSQYSLAFKDMLICGVGATNTTINYDNNPDGEVEVRRVFPAFVFWDVTARAKNVIDANYVVEVKVLDQKCIKEYYGLDSDFDYNYTQTGDSLDVRIMQFYESILAVKSLGVVYEYQWRTKEDFYRVENPFLDKDQMTLMQPDEMESLSMLAAQMTKQFKFDPTLDRVFSVEDQSDLKDLKEMFGFYNIELEYTKQKKYKYYRAIITNGKVIEKSESFSQTGFTIKFRTGQFSELDQMYYGLGRGCKDPQRMLNQTVSDYTAFLQTIPKGGVHIESDAVSDVTAFIQTYAKARSVTVFNPGALSSGKMMPKPTPALPSGILEMIQYADSQIMQVCGVTPEFMGIMDSKEMNTSFFRQQIKQGLTPLTTYMDAEYTALQSQGELYIDCIRVLVDNCEGRLIKNVIGEKNAPYIQLLKDGVAEQYDVIVDEVPDITNEHTAIAMKLLELQQLMPQANLIPIAIKLMDIPEDIKQEVQGIMQPPPPAQPDPVNVRLLTSQAMLNESNAQKTMAEAQKVQSDTAMQQEQIPYTVKETETNIELTHAKTLAELAKAGKTHVDATHTRLNPFNLKFGDLYGRNERSPSQP